MEITLERRALIRKYNELRKALEAKETKLARMEAHEGEDGIPEDVEGQCALVDAIGIQRREYYAVKKQLYPNG